MPSPESLRILTIIAFICLLAIGMRRVVFLPVAYMILVYCKVTSYYPIFGEIKAELVFALLILIRLFVTGEAIDKLSLQKNSINKYLLLFTACIFLSFAVAWDKQYAWDNAVYHFIKVFILYFMVLLSIENEKDLKIFIWSLILIYTYLAYEPVYNYIAGVGGSQQMYGVNYIADSGILAGHVGLANNMNQMIPIVFYLVFGIQDKQKKIFASIPLIIFIICLIGSGSRGGVLGFMVFGLCIVYFSKNRVKVGLLSASLCVLLLIFTGLSSTTKRINVQSGQGRFTGLTHGIEMVKRGNLLGVGPGCFLFARGKYFGYTMESHNIYGQVMGELGIPGTIAWFFFIRQIFINLIEAKRNLRRVSLKQSFLYSLAMGLHVSLIVRLFVCMASHSLYFFYWYVVAPLSFILLIISKKYEEEYTAIQ